MEWPALSPEAMGTSGLPASVVYGGHFLCWCPRPRVTTKGREGMSGLYCHLRHCAELVPPTGLDSVLELTLTAGELASEPAPKGSMMEDWPDIQSSKECLEQKGVVNHPSCVPVAG